MKCKQTDNETGKVIKTRSAKRALPYYDSFVLHKHPVMKNESS